MARQASFLKLEGGMGDVSFYQTSTDGFLARTKGGISAERIKNDPKFERTRENGVEFGHANEASRLLRTAFRSLIAGSADSRMSSRLSAKMMSMLKGDVTSKRGLRKVMGGDVTELLNFEFNAKGLLAHTLFAPYVTTIDRAANTARINLAAFVPNETIKAPAGSTHVRLASAVAEIDFEGKTYAVKIARSTDIVLGPQQQPALILTHALEPNTTRSLFVVLGIEFRQEVNQELYPLKNGAFNALAIVAAEA